MAMARRLRSSRRRSPPSEEERDWAGLLPELVSKIADDLLTMDATEYVRLRAVCKPWRRATAAPSLRQPRFFPRNWVVIPGGEGSEPHRFRNVLTGATLRIRLPMPRHEFTYHGSTEGLLLLCPCLEDTPCLLNPLTMEFADLPTMGAAPGDVYFPLNDITAAGVVVDEEEEGGGDPTVVICATQGRRSAMFHAKPGNLVWQTVDVGCVAAVPKDDGDKLPSFKGGLAMRGRFYVPTRAGDVLTVALRPRPHLAYLIRQQDAGGWRGPSTCSYLAPSLAGDDDDHHDGMLLLCCYLDGSRQGGFDAFAVNVAERSLTQLQSIGNRTIFLPSWTIRSDKFRKLKKERGVVRDCRNLARYLA